METKVRVEPRISVNKLSEYVKAMPGRRKTIIKQQKNPPSFIVPYYTPVEDIIVDYFCGGRKDIGFLSQRLEELSELVTIKEWKEKQKKICIDAVTSFSEFANEINLGMFNCIAGTNGSERLIINEVQVSIRPEILLVDNTGKVQGCVKLILGKSRLVDEIEAAYTGACLQRWMQENHNISNYKTCFVVDIFGKKVHTAPKAYKSRMNDVEAACEEISKLWAGA